MDRDWKDTGANTAVLTRYLPYFITGLPNQL